MRAIIVGASSGIGLETARLLIKKGYEVVNISRSDAEGIQTIHADAAVSGSVKDAVIKAAEQQPVDVFIYSAGYSMASPVEYAAESDYKYLFDVNFFGLIEAVAAIVPYMKKSGGGRIILLSSMAATFPIVFDAFYSASKAAVDTFALAAAMELKPFNIRVTSVKPGGVSTRFTYKRKVYGDSEVFEYALKQRKAVATLNKEEQTGMSPHEVAQIIYTLITKPSPPLITACGMKNKSRLFAERFVSKRALVDMSMFKYDQ